MAYYITVCRSRIKMRKKIFYYLYFLGLVLFFNFFIFLLFSKVPKFFDLTLFFWGNIFMGASCLVNYYNSNSEEKSGEFWWQNLIGFHCCLQSLTEVLPFKLLFLSILTTFTSCMIYFKRKKISSTTKYFNRN